MKRIYLPEACNALGIDSATLYRWLKRAGIQVQQDEIDKRKRYITQADVRTLARLHGIHSSGSYHADAMQISDISERIDELESKLTALVDSKLAVLQKQIDELKEQIATGARGESVMLADFARLHHVSKTSYKRYAEKIGAHKDAHHIWYVDAAARSKFYQQFHTSKGFERCPSCPHNVET